jgi:hypothetical protein
VKQDRNANKLHLLELAIDRGKFSLASITAQGIEKLDQVA